MAKWLSNGSEEVGVVFNVLKKNGDNVSPFLGFCNMTGWKFRVAAWHLLELLCIGDELGRLPSSADEEQDSVLSVTFTDHEAGDVLPSLAAEEAAVSLEMSQLVWGSSPQPSTSKHTAADADNRWVSLLAHVLVMLMLVKYN